MAITKIPAAGFTGNNFRNIIINGDMSIAQRGTSFSSISAGNGTFPVDRFRNNMTGAGTWTISQDTTVPTGQGFAKSVKYDCTTADASLAAGDFLILQQLIEGQNLQYLKKGTSSAESLTVSFWVRSNKTGTYISELYDEDNTRNISQSYTISSANTWEKKTITFAGDTSGALNNDNGASLTLNFWLAAGSTYSSGTLNTSWNSNTNANRAAGQVNLADSTSNEWYVTGVQLEAETTASDFEFLPVDVNLQRCQRYYEKSYAQGTTPGTTTDDGRNMFFFNNTASGYVGGFSKYVVTKRATPTITTYAPGNGTSGQASYYVFGSSTTNTGITVAQINDVGFTVYGNGTSCDSVAFHYQVVSEL